ncbi:MAG TPA: DUF1318 domain-containing protein [Desulfuromonadales bacterium]|nr:DUF1318 domain-containing protein [Desulfuromonadales bacterium]
MKNNLLEISSNIKHLLKHGATEQRSNISEQFFLKIILKSFVTSPLLRCSVLFGLLLSASACTLAKVDVNVVSERTSLENQVLGTYNSLSQDMLLVASVRGVSPSGKIDAAPRHTPEQRDATRALETIAFHADDIESFKKFGWIGENNEGLLTPFPRETPKVTSEELKSFAANYSDAEFQQVVKEVNQSRETLMLRVVQTNENFTLKDLPAIRTVFARINRQNSAPGAKVQEADGRWVANITTPQPPP